MLVKLVVCDNREFGEQFGVCCGAGVTDILTESLIGDDRRPHSFGGDYSSPEAVRAEQDAIDNWYAYHFPRLKSDSDLIDEVSRHLSREYLAVLVLGTTGWSGWHEGEGRYWTCSFDDLTDEGKALYRQIEALYPGCDLHLLTFLDT